MASIISTALTFKPTEHMIYTKIKANKTAGKSVGIINTESKKSLFVQTPLIMTWGVNKYENVGKDDSYDLALQFPRSEFSNEDTTNLLDMFKSFEDCVMDEACKMSKEWFGKNLSREVIESRWTPMLKFPKDESGEPDKTRSPTLKVKCPIWNGEYKFELFDVNHVALNPSVEGTTLEECIQKGSNIACIIQCGGVWFTDKAFGVTWKLYQGVVKPLDVLEKGKCHINVSVEDKELLNKESSTTESTVTTATYDSDGEEEETSKPDDPEPEPEPEPEPKPESMLEPQPIAPKKTAAKKGKK